MMLWVNRAGVGLFALSTFAGVMSQSLHNQAERPRFDGVYLFSPEKNIKAIQMAVTPERMRLTIALTDKTFRIDSELLDAKGFPMPTTGNLSSSKLECSFDGPPILNPRPTTPHVNCSARWDGPAIVLSESTVSNPPRGTTVTLSLSGDDLTEKIEGTMPMGNAIEYFLYAHRISAK